MDIDLKNLSKIQGFKIGGANPNDESGSAVSGAGDINGDGINDIIIGAPFASPLNRTRAGESYVVFGKKDIVFSDIDLIKFNYTLGFKIIGAQDNDNSGNAVSGIGDINGDDIDDIIIGASNASRLNFTQTGECYVIFGRNSTFYENIDLAKLNYTQGFKIINFQQESFFGQSVNSAGDFNNDSINDIIIGAKFASPFPDRYRAGESYIIFGKKNISDINITTFDKYQGFKIYGRKTHDDSGQSVSGIKDFNGDKIDDVIIGANYASPKERQNAGESYIIFGKKSIFFENIDLATLNITQGFKILGANRFDNTGFSVSDAGDINSDGFNDVIIGAFGARSNAGVSYVIFGKKAFSNDIDLLYLDATQGFKIFGASSSDQAGTAVSSAGDINGDKIDDVIISAPPSKNGVNYVIFGKKASNFEDISLDKLKETQGFKINGLNQGKENANLVSSIGDINSDEINDIIIGSPFSSFLNRTAGESYIIYGTKPPLPTPWWMPYLEIELPATIGGIILTAGLTYGVYKYKQEGTICGFHIGDPEQTHLINEAPVDSETWYT